MCMMVDETFSDGVLVISPNFSFRWMTEVGELRVHVHLHRGFRFRAVSAYLSE